MDDIISGAKIVKTALNLQNELIETLKYEREILLLRNHKPERNHHKADSLIRYLQDIRSTRMVSADNHQSKNIHSTFVEDPGRMG